MSQVKYSSLCLLIIHHNMWSVFCIIYKISPCHDNYYKNGHLFVLRFGYSYMASCTYSAGHGTLRHACWISLRLLSLTLYGWPELWCPYTIRLELTYSLVKISSKLRKIFILMHTLWMSATVIHLTVALSFRGLSLLPSLPKLLHRINRDLDLLIEDIASANEYLLSTHNELSPFKLSMTWQRLHDSETID